MTDDEILAVANEVLVPAGIENAWIRKAPMRYGLSDGDDCRTLCIPPPVQPPSDAPSGGDFYAPLFWRTQQGLAPDYVRGRALDIMIQIEQSTEYWPIPWKRPGAWG